MAILIVEDEPSVASVIKRGLADYGFESSIAPNGFSGLQQAGERPYELIILDVMLPDLDGVQVCKQIRQQNANVPIMMLTALDSTENVVKGLDSGADDYMAKPFKMMELAARVRSLLRRRGNEANVNTIYKIAGIELDTEAKVATNNQVPLVLTPTEYRLLEYFIKNQKKVLTRIQILENVWDIDFNLGTNVVDVYVNYLRKKLDKDNPNKLIHTIFGMGYMMKDVEENENSK